MYIPSHFTMNEKESIFNMIDSNSFATLFSQHNGMPFATQLPLLLDRENEKLYGHFARANSHWQDIENQLVLVVFSGPHCYISPSWYETSIAVPTWNYVSVHVYGQVKIVEDVQELMEMLRPMVKKYETPESPYILDEIESSYIEGMARAIVGFEIKINKIEGKQKLSQNHPIERQKLIIEQLKQMSGEDAQQIALLMESNLHRKG